MFFHKTAILSILALLSLWWNVSHARVMSAEESAALQGGHSVTVAQRYLGINTGFGRWDGVVRLVYDPDNYAQPSTDPTMFADSQTVLGLIQQATAEWEKVSGIKFEITGTDSNALIDEELSSAQSDGLVRVFWGTANGNAGLAGADFGDWSDSLGYYPYYDGSVELSWDSDTWTTQEGFVSTLVHELGHLIALGHSDNPGSVMYADPYNHLYHPREDDILAVQQLYGPPTTAIDISQPLSDWVYTPPANAPATTTQYLFKPNQHTTASSYDYIATGDEGTTPLTSVTSSTVDSEWVWFNSGGYGNWDSTTDINIAASIITVDPFGYSYGETSMDLSCPAGSACGGSRVGLVQVSVAKSIPGSWNVYVVDKSTDANNPVTLSHQSFSVDTTVSRNMPPSATLTAVAGPNDNSVTFTVNASDAESNNISVIWHPIGPREDRDGDNWLENEITDPNISGGSVTRTLTFPGAGSYTLFVEVNDDGPRYSTANASNAGEGFQNLLRVDLTVPYQVTTTDTDTVTTPEVVEVESDPDPVPSSGQAIFDFTTTILSIPAVDVSSPFGVTSYSVEMALILGSNPMSFSVDVGSLAVTTAGDEVSHSTYSADGLLSIPVVQVGDQIYRVEMRATTVNGALAFELTGVW